MIYKDNPEYKEVFYSEINDVRFYQPVNISNYHTNRYITAMEQNIYSSSGATKEYLEIITDEMLTIINKANTETIKTDLAVLVNNIKFRLKSPIDQDAAVRMGAIYALMDNEDESKVHPHITAKKMEYADKDPELYAFFLSTGVVYTASWTEYLEHLEMTPDYFSNRAETLRSLSLQVRDKK